MLSDRDQQIIHAALRATVEGPFFPDWEFATLTGMDREEMREVLAKWPDASDQESEDRAIHAALLNLTGYPHGEWDAWPRFSDAAPEEVDQVQWRWLADREARRSV